MSSYYKILRDIREPAVLKRVKATNEGWFFRQSPLRGWLFIMMGLSFLVLGVSIFLVVVRSKIPLDEIGVMHSCLFALLGSVLTLLGLLRAGARSHLVINRRTGTYHLKRYHLIRREVASGSLSELEGVSFYARHFHFGFTLKGRVLIPIWTLSLKFKKLAPPVLIAESTNKQKIEQKLILIARMLQVPMIYWNGGVEKQFQWSEITSRPYLEETSPAIQMPPPPYGSKILFTEELSEEKIVQFRKIVLPTNKYSFGLALQHILSGIFIIIGILMFAYMLKIFNTTEINPIFYTLFCMGFIVGGLFLGNIDAINQVTEKNIIIEDAENLIYFQNKFDLDKKPFIIFSKWLIKDISIKAGRDFFINRKQELAISAGRRTLRIGRQLNPRELVWLQETILTMIGKRERK